MCIDASVSRRARQILILSVRDMEMRPRVTVFFGKTKVDHVNLIASFSNTHHKVVRFDVAMDKVL